MRPTMSKLGLLSACQYWAREGVPWTSQTSDDASFGRALHALAEAYIDGKPFPETPTDPALADAWARLLDWLRGRVRSGWRTEVPFAYHVQQGTARELPKTEHRDYSGAGPAELCGTTDLVYMDGDDDGPFACVDDFKWSGFHGDAQRAQAQLAGLGLCVARAWDVDRVRARAIRIGPGGPVDDWSEVYWLDAFDLAAMEAQIRCDVEAIARAEPKPGEHCSGHWCPALAACPATQGTLAKLVPDVALVRKDGWRYGPAIESPDHLAWMMGIRPLLKRVMEQTDKAGAAYVAEGPVKTSKGFVVEQKWRNMSRLNVGALEELARAKGATDEEVAGCFRTSRESNGIRVSPGAKRGRAA